ncbi:MAG: VOC family protein [Cocleimonas sp.]|nr:VOC family protein [Cocleimonas sp.]
MTFLGFDHVSLIVNNTERALTFYHHVLGLDIATDRPKLPFKGAWLIVATHQQIHLLEVPNPDSLDRPEHGGRDRHVAFRVPCLNNIRQQLETNKISYSLSKSGRKALFCRDFDGNTLELIE